MTPARTLAETFPLNLKNRNWMTTRAFARFLNRMGQTRAKYGGVMVKKTESNSELRLHVVPWLDLITGQTDIRNGVKIERHYYTPAQLKTDAPKGWENLDDAITAAKKSREANASNPDNKDNKAPGAYVEVFEVHNRNDTDQTPAALHSGVPGFIWRDVDFAVISLTGGRNDCWIYIQFGRHALPCSGARTDVGRNV